MTTYADRDDLHVLRRRCKELEAQCERLESSTRNAEFEHLKWKYEALCRLDLHERTIERSVRRTIRYLAEALESLARGLRFAVSGWELRRQFGYVRRKRGW
jgi:hypothetical protein